MPHDPGCRGGACPCPDDNDSPSRPPVPAGPEPTGPSWPPPDPDFKIEEF